MKFKRWTTGLVARFEHELHFESKVVVGSNKRGRSDDHEHIHKQFESQNERTRFDAPLWQVRSVGQCENNVAKDGRGKGSQRQLRLRGVHEQARRRVGPARTGRLRGARSNYAAELEQGHHGALSAHLHTARAHRHNHATASVWPSLQRSAARCDQVKRVQAKIKTKKATTTTTQQLVKRVSIFVSLLRQLLLSISVVLVRRAKQFDWFEKFRL